jgi:hypothetical protein
MTLRAMPTKLSTLSPRTLSRALLVCAAIAPFAITVACGGDKKPPVDGPPTPTASATDSVATTPTDTTTSSAPTPPPSAEPPAVEKKSKKADKKQDASFAACHKDYKPGGKSVEGDVTKLAKSCEKATSMKLVGKMITAKQDAEGKPQTYPLKAAAGKCYRVYAESETGIKDLDLAIKDSNGDIAGEDSTDDPSPIVLEDGAVCFKEADDAQVIVSVGMGKGKYALQIWSD